MNSERNAAERNKGAGVLSASALKYIAIIAMTIDHIAWRYVETTSSLGIIMHFIGRTTAPVMFYFITEGYHHTRSVPRYMLRMGIFAAISYYPFRVFYGDCFGAKAPQSVILELMLCLFAVHIVNDKKLNDGFRLPMIVVIMYLSKYCDWGYTGVVFTLAFELARDSGRKIQIAAYGAAALIYVLPTIALAFDSMSIFMHRSYQFGVFLPIALLAMYNGKPGRGDSTLKKNINKWLFYIYYPLHLGVLTLIGRYLHD